MKKYICSLVLIAACMSPSFAQMRSGLLVGGGMGSLAGAKPSATLEREYPSGLYFDKDYKYNVSLGYKFRLPTEGRVFYDINVYLGYKTLRYKYEDMALYEEILYTNTGGTWSYYSLSVNPVWNYKLFKGLYAGVGIEPTLYYVEEPNVWRFDVPLKAVMGYDFRRFGLEVNYKFGLFNISDKENLKSGRMSDWQVQLFVPF